MKVLATIKGVSPTVKVIVAKWGLRAVRELEEGLLSLGVYNMAVLF